MSASRRGDRIGPAFVGEQAKQHRLVASLVEEPGRMPFLAVFRLRGTSAVVQPAGGGGLKILQRRLGPHLGPGAEEAGLGRLLVLGVERYLSLPNQAGHLRAERIQP